MTPSQEKRRLEAVEEAIELLLSGGTYSRRSLLDSDFGNWNYSLLDRLEQYGAITQHKRGRGKSVLYEVKDQAMLEAMLEEPRLLTAMIWPHHAAPFSDLYARFVAAKSDNSEEPPPANVPHTAPPVLAPAPAVDSHDPPSDRDLAEGQLKLTMATAQSVADLDQRLDRVEDALVSLAQAMDGRTSAILDLMTQLLREWRGDKPGEEAG